MSRGANDDGVATTLRILDVAERLAQVRGFNGFSYGDIATELGITRAALHYHYPSKTELGRALLERYSFRFAAALAALDTAELDVADRLQGYARLFADVLVADRMCLCGMLAAEFGTLPPSLQAGVSAFFADNTRWLTTLLEEGRQQRSLRFPGPSEETAAMVLGGLEGAMLIARLDGDVVRFNAAADRLIGSLIA